MTIRHALSAAGHFWYTADEEAADSIEQLDVWKRCLSVLFALVILLYVAAWTPKWNPGRDSAGYLGVGRNLAEGRGYTFNGRVRYWYSPGLPLLWAGIVRTFGESFRLLNAFMILTALGTAWATYLTFRQFTNHPMSVAVGFVVLCSHSVVFKATCSETDLPFFFFVTLGLFGAHVFFRGRPWGLAVMIPALLIAYAFRVAGIVLLFWLFAGLMLQRTDLRPRRQLLGTALAALPIAAVFVVWLILQVKYRLPDDMAYFRTASAHLLGPSRSTLQRLGEGLAALPAQIIRLVSNLQIAGVPSIVIVPPVLLGMVHEVRRGRRALAIAFLGYAASQASLVGSTGVGKRYLMPMLPWLVHYILVGTTVLGCVFRKRWRRLRPKRWCQAVLVFLVVVGIAEAVRLVVTIHLSRGQWVHHSHWGDLESACRWTAENTSPADTVLTGEASIVAYFARRRTYPITSPDRNDATRLRKDVEGKRPTIIIAREKEVKREVLEKVVLPVYRLVTEKGRYAIYRRTGPAGSESR